MHVQRLGEGDSSVDVALGDPSEIAAEIREAGMVPRADIGAEGGQRPAGGAVDEHGRELDDLLWVDHRAFLAGRLEIDHHKEIEHLAGCCCCGGGGRLGVGDGRSSLAGEKLARRLRTRGGRSRRDGCRDAGESARWMSRWRANRREEERDQISEMIRKGKLS